MLARVILFAAALVAVPVAAQADPITAIWTAIQAGAGFWSAVGGYLASSAFATFALQLVGYAALSAISQRLMRSNAASVKAERDLRAVTSTPPHRFVYGGDNAIPTWVIGPYKVDGYLYGALLLNSRASHALDALAIDDRAVTLTGDLYDFAGSGAVVSEEPFVGHIWLWAGLGDQTTAPDDIVTGSGGKIVATDAWRGRTVLWAKILEGPQEKWLERWPNWPPEFTPIGRWSKVWNPQDPAQDKDDPATWVYSDNQALCLLDLARQNPIEKWPDDLIDMTGFALGQDLADEDFPLKEGGTQKRYTVSGTAIFDGSGLADILTSVADAGAGRITLIGGKLSYIPGCWRTPVMSLGQALDGKWEFERLKQGRDLPNTIYCVHRGNAASNYEPIPLSAYSVPGSVAEDGGERADEMSLAMVSNTVQAQYLQQIEAKKKRLQRSWTGTLPPEAFDLLDGSVVTLAMPAPYTALNADYEVISAAPTADMVGEGGVAMRVPVKLRELTEDVYSWTPLTDQREVQVSGFTPTDIAIAPPSDVQTEVVAMNTGTAVVDRIRFTALPSPSDAATHVEWQWREAGGIWSPSTFLDDSIVDGSGRVVGYIDNPAVDTFYELRLRATSAVTVSDWVTVTGIALDFALSGIAAVASFGRVEIDVTAPDATAFAGVRVYRAATADFGAASDVSGLIAQAPGATFTAIAGDATATNIVTNGTFDDATGWTLPGGWSVASGVASHTASGANETMYRPASMTVGEDYRWTVTMSGYAAGSALVRLMGASNVNSGAIAADGLHQGTLTAPASPANVGILAGTTCTADFDDLVIVQDTPACLPQGAAYFWIVPETQTGTQGTPEGPYLLTVY